jgi:hypothetical protein
VHIYKCGDKCADEKTSDVQISDYKCADEKEG